MDEGVAKIVYGLKRLSAYAVEVEGGKIMYRPPPFPIGDCRSCALIDDVCEELEHPCQVITRRCEKWEEKLCEGCEEFDECLNSKPCCWECDYLLNCIEMYGNEMFKSTYGCDCETFVEAVKMLKRQPSQGLHRGVE